MCCCLDSEVKFRVPSGPMSAVGSLNHQKVKPERLVATMSKSGPFPGRGLGIPSRTSTDMRGLTPGFPRVPPLGTHRHGWGDEWSCSLHALSHIAQRKGMGKRSLACVQMNRRLQLHCNQVLELISFMCFHYIRHHKISLLIECPTL